MLPALLVDGNGLRRHLGPDRWSLGGTVSLDECDLFANPDTTVKQEWEATNLLCIKDSAIVSSLMVVTLRALFMRVILVSQS